MNLVEFLTARLDEDEGSARVANAVGTVVGWHYAVGSASAWGDHGRISTPDYVLAEVESKRQLIRYMAQAAATVDGEWGCCHDAGELVRGKSDAFQDLIPSEPLPDDCAGVPVLRDALKLMALPYSNHPDFQQEW